MYCQNGINGPHLFQTNDLFFTPPQFQSKWLASNILLYYNKAYKEQHDGDSHELKYTTCCYNKKKVKKKKVLKEKTTLNCQLLLPLQMQYQATILLYRLT